MTAMPHPHEGHTRGLTHHSATWGDAGTLDGDGAGAVASMHSYATTARSHSGAAVGGAGVAAAGVSHNPYSHQHNPYSHQLYRVASPPRLQRPVSAVSSGGGHGRSASRPSSAALSHHHAHRHARSRSSRRGERKWRDDSDYDDDDAGIVDDDGSSDGKRDDAYYGRGRSPSSRGGRSHSSRPGSARPRSATHRSVSRPRSAHASYGTPHQAMGAQGLPASVDIDDPESVRAHVVSLHTMVRALAARIASDRVSLARSRAEAGKLRRTVALLHARPSPIINLAKSRLSQLTGPDGRLVLPLSPTAAAALGVDDEAEAVASVASLPVLAREATVAQEQLKQALAKLASGGGAGAAGADDAVHGPAIAADEEECGRLRAAVAAMRGRITALRSRLAREEALAHEQAIQAAAFAPTAALTATGAGDS